MCAYMYTNNENDCKKEILNLKEYREGYIEEFGRKRERGNLMIL